jgi:fibronectin type 3 domain-containing protein
MKIRIYLLTIGAAIVILTAATFMLGCGQGFSTAGNSSPKTVPPTSTHSVSLSWSASTSSDVSGYNIYRAIYSDSCGAFSKINPSLNTSTSYTDSAVTNGSSYCYATTALNTSNEESAYSNVVSNVQIPSP